MGWTEQYQKTILFFWLVWCSNFSRLYSQCLPTWTKQFRIKILFRKNYTNSQLLLQLLLILNSKSLAFRMSSVLLHSDLHLRLRDPISSIHYLHSYFLHFPNSNSPANIISIWWEVKHWRCHRLIINCYTEKFDERFNFEWKQMKRTKWFKRAETILINPIRKEKGVRRPC